MGSSSKPHFFHLDYEWGKAQRFERQANGNRQQAFDNLELVLSVTVNPIDRNILLNTGAWMMKHWGVKHIGDIQEKKPA